MGDIEVMIARNAPKLMKAGGGPGTGTIRDEPRPKSTKEAKTSFRLISPEAGEAILAMHAAGKGGTEIADYFRISPEAVRTHLRKNNVKPNHERTRVLRSSEYRGVTRVTTK